MDIVYQIKQAYKNALPKEEVLQLYRSVEDKDQTFDTDGGISLMHLAANYADYEAVQLLLESGAKAMVINRYDYTPLRSLCNSIHDSKPSYDDIYKTTIVLLEAKVSTLRKDESGKTCAHVAAEKGIYPMIQALADHGAKIGMTDNYGLTPLHSACKDVRHVIDGIPYAETRLKQRQEAASKKTGSENFDRLNRESVITAENNLKAEKALLEDYFKVVKTLVEYGLDPDEKDNSENTALDYAIKSKAKKIAAFLKGEYDENNPDSIVTGGMNLHQAIEQGDIEALRALAVSGKDVNEVSDDYPFKGMTPLAAACVKVNPEAVQILLDAGADPNFKAGEHGYTALYFFIHRASSNVNSNTYKNKDIQRILKSLKTAGLNINDFIDDESNTAFIEACRISSSVRINSNSFDGVLIETIMDLGCDVNMSNKNGQTPLMLMAAKNLDTENLFITLLENEAKTDMVDKNGNTPLMYAAKNRDQSASKTYIDLMVEFGDLKIDAVNNDGKTALAIATEMNHEAVVKQLLIMQ